MKLRQVHYAWVMVVIAIGVLAAHALTLQSFGVFFKPIATEFNWDRGALSFSYSITILVTGGLALVVVIAGRAVGVADEAAFAGVEDVDDEIVAVMRWAFIDVPFEDVNNNYQMEFCTIKDDL